MFIIWWLIALMTFTPWSSAYFIGPLPPQEMQDKSVQTEVTSTGTTITPTCPPCPDTSLHSLSFLLCSLMVMCSLLVVFWYTFYIANQCSYKLFKNELMYNLKMIGLIDRGLDDDQQLFYKQQCARLYGLDDDFCGSSFKDWNAGDSWENSDSGSNTSTVDNDTKTSQTSGTTCEQMDESKSHSVTVSNY